MSDDADLLEQSAAAATPEERAAVFGFDLSQIQRAASRLRLASNITLFIGVVGLFLFALGDAKLDLGSTVLGALLGFAAPVVTFVVAQIIVRVFRGSRPSTLAIATAPATTVLSALLLLGALSLTPHDAGGFAGLLIGTWASGSIEAGGHVATSRVFDRHSPFLARTARMWNEFPHWASLAFGQWVWIFVFSLISELTGVAALLVFRDGTIATVFVVVGLAIASALESWATKRGSAWLRLAVGLVALAAIVATWLLV